MHRSISNICIHRLKDEVFVCNSMYILTTYSHFDKHFHNSNILTVPDSAGTHTLRCVRTVT
jgi:hypothetical protein